MIQRWDDLTEAEQKRILKAQLADVDDDSMTWDGYQYAQVGQGRCLGDEVRELRAKVEKQDRELRYWRGAFFDLSLSVASVLTLYGWGHDMDYVDGLSRVRKDIEALRQRIRELKGQEKAVPVQAISQLMDAFENEGFPFGYLLQRNAVTEWLDTQAKE